MSATFPGPENGSVLTPSGEARWTAAAGAPARPADRPVVVALAPRRYRVQFTVGSETHDKLRRAQDLLRREIPDGDPGAIFDRALSLLLEDAARKKVAVTSNPRRPKTTGTHGRHVPARVKRAVWLRDGGRCAFVASSGRRCSERTFLEFHHQEPYAVGGEATVTNISLRGRAHNAYEAELVFGVRGRVSRVGQDARGGRGAVPASGAASRQSGRQAHLGSGPCARPGASRSGREAIERQDPGVGNRAQRDACSWGRSRATPTGETGAQIGPGPGARTRPGASPATRGIGRGDHRSEHTATAGTVETGA